MKKRGMRLLSALLAAVMTFGCLPAGAVMSERIVMTDEKAVQQAVEEALEEVLEPPEQDALTEVDMTDQSTWPTAGTLGESGQFTWGMNTADPQNYVLTIRGDGDLPDWSKSDQKPWYPWRVDTIRLYGNITAIGDYNFNFGFRYISLPGTLKRIGDYAMANCVMTGVNIPYGVTEIGEGAFNGADLEWVDIPDTVTNIGKYAFASTKLKAVVIPDSVTGLGEGAFQASELRTFVLPASLTEIPDYCFNAVEELTEWEIPDRITSIGAYAFRNTGLKELYIPDTVTGIGEHAFEGSDLGTVTIAADISRLPKYGFKGCKSLDWVEIQSPVTEIPEGFFYQCSALRGVILPETVTSVHNTGFYQNETLLGVFARGPGVSSESDLAYAFWSGIAKSTVPTVYYLEDQTGWAGLKDEGCSDTMWYGHPLEFWDGVNAELPVTTVADYYATPERKFFCIQVPGACYPRPTGFQIQVGDEIYNTGDRDRMTIPIPSDFEGKIIFSKEGYITYEMPAELAGSFNWVTLWRDDGGTAPIVQGIYIDKSSGQYKGFCNLKENDYTIYEMDRASRRFYVSVLWRDGEEGTISLVQDGKEIVQLENNAWTSFQPGMKFTVAGKGIYLKVENSNTKTTTSLKLHMRTPTKKMDVPFGPSVSGNTGNGCEAMQDESLELKINGGMLPVSMKVEGNKVIGIIGFSAEASKIEAAFNHAKELVNEADDGLGGNIFEQFANLYKGLTGKKDIWPKRSASMVIKSDIKFLGYFEGSFELDENGELDVQFGMSKLAVKLEGKSAYTQQTVVIGIPVYWELELGAMLEMAFQLYQEEGIEEARLPELNMTTELSLAGALAVGIVDVVGAGIKGKGAFVAQTKLPIDPDDMTLKLTGELSAFVTLVGLTGEKKLLEDEYVFYEDGVWYPSERMRARAFRMLEESLNLEKVSRDYLEDGTDFVANEEPRLRAIVPETGTVTTKQIMVNNYPYADPQLATLPDGNQVLVWLEDDGTENAGTALQFSVYDGKKWSEPAAVESDGTSDFNPELKLVGDTLYLLWLDAEQAILADCVDVAEISAKLDVSMACFDAENLVFGEVTTFGQSGMMDILPDVTAYQEQPVLAWVSSSGSLLSMESCDLWLAGLEEDGWKTKAAGSLGDVDSLCVDTLHGALSVTFSQSAGEAEDFSAKELFTLRYLRKNGAFEQVGELVRRTENDVIDTAPRNHGGLLYWYQDGILVNTAGQSLDIGGSGSKYQIIDDGDGKYAVVYAAPQSDDTFDFYVVMDDGTGWSRSVLAASSTGWVENWSAQFNGKGYLTIAASERESFDAAAALTVYTITPKKDLAVNGLYYDSYTLIPGEALSVFAEVENVGLTEVSSYMLTGKLDGSSAGSYFGGTLRPGEKETVSFTCTIPEGGAAELAVALGSDTNRDNNTVTAALAKQDLSVEGVNLNLCPDGTGEATVSVINRGGADSGAAALTLKRIIPANGINAQAQWEVLSEVQTVGVLTPQTMTEYTIPLTAPVAEGDMIYAVLEIPDADSLSENNSDFAVAVLPVEEGMVYDDSKLVEQTGTAACVQVAAENRGSQSVRGMICVAAYDGAKMTDSRTLTLSAMPGQCLLEQIKLTCPEGGEVRMFVLNPDTCVPMTQARVLKP